MYIYNISGAYQHKCLQTLLIVLEECHRKLMKINVCGYDELSLKNNWSNSLSFVRWGEREFVMPPKVSSP